MFYIFGYTEQNRKARITGFVKTQFQSAVLLVQSGLELSICIKGLYTKEPADFQVYVYACEKQEVLAVQVGTITVVGGHGTCTMTLPVENIAESGFGLEEICGLIITQGAVKQQDVEFEKMISKWEDTEGDFTRIQYHATKKIEVHMETEEKRAVQEQQKMSDRDEMPEQMGAPGKIDTSEDAQTEPQTEQLQSEELQTEQSQTEQPQTEQSRVKQETEQLQIEQSQSEQSQREMPQPAAVSAEPEVQAAAVKNAAKESKMELYFKNHQHIDAFDDDDYYHCIEVTPEQLQNMLGDQMNVQANSFIMHGFYTFRHILVARVCNDPDTIMIGVPGVYSNKERFMASMFGFSNFKRSHRADCRNQCFGYWYSSAMYT